MTDNDIIDLYFARDDRAVTWTAAQYGTPLFHLAQRFVAREDAEECVNDTYMSAWNHIPPTRPAHFFAWLAKVCRNHVISRTRWNDAVKRSTDLVELSDELSQCIPDERYNREREAEELGAALSEFLRSLPQEKRVMFLRRYWFGDSVAEVAEQLGITESKVKVTLHRVRGQLKIYLEKEDIPL